MITENGALKERILWIDAIKGVGIMMVMTSHMLSIPYDWVLYVGFIPFFFFVSGYTYKQKDNIKTLIVDKSKRLLIPYFVYSVFALIVDLFLGYIDKNSMIIRVIGIFYSRFCLYQWRTPDNIIFLYGNGPLWFLPAMFLSLILVYVFIKVHKKVFWGNVVALILLYSIIAHYSPILSPWSLDIIPVYTLFVIIGYNFKMGGGKIIINRYLWCGLCFLFLALSYINGYTNISVGIYGGKGIFSIILYILCSTIETFLLWKALKNLSYHIPIVIKVLAYIGKCSLRLMCIHYPIYLIVINFSNNFNTVSRYFIYVTCLTFVFLANFILCVLYDKYRTKYSFIKYL